MPVNAFGQPVGDALPGWTPPPFPPHTAMAGRFCTLEPLTPAHAPALWDAFSLDTDGRNWTYLAHDPFTRYADFEAWVAQSAASTDPQFYAVVAGEQEPAVGSRELAVGSRELAVGSRELAVGSRELAVGSREPAAGSREPAAGNREPSAPSASSAAPSAAAAGVAAYLRITPPAGTIEVGHIHFSPRLQHTPAATEAMYLMMRRVFELGYRRYEWKCDALNAPSRRAAERLGFSFEGVFRQALVTKGRNRDTAWYACIDREWPVLRAGFERWLSPANFDGSGRQRQSLAEARTTPLPIAD